MHRGWRCPTTQTLPQDPADQRCSSRPLWCGGIKDVNPTFYYAISLYDLAVVNILSLYVIFLTMMCCGLLFLLLFIFSWYILDIQCGYVDSLALGTYLKYCPSLLIFHGDFLTGSLCTPMILMSFLLNLYKTSFYICSHSLKIFFIL